MNPYIICIFLKFSRLTSHVLTSHVLTLSRSHSLTFSLSHSLTLSRSHSLTLSRSHSLTLVSFIHPSLQRRHTLCHPLRHRLSLEVVIKKLRHPDIEIFPVLPLHRPVRLTTIIEQPCFFRRPYLYRQGGSEMVKKYK